MTLILLLSSSSRSICYITHVNKMLRVVGVRDKSAFETSHLDELIGAQFQTLFMPLREEIRYNHASSRRLIASLGLLSHNLSCLVITHVIHLRNLKSDPEKALYAGRFHTIIFRYFDSKRGQLVFNRCIQSCQVFIDRMIYIEVIISVFDFLIRRTP
jgi:hypothetical protein